MSARGDPSADDRKLLAARLGTHGPLGSGEPQGAVLFSGDSLSSVAAGWPTRTAGLKSVRNRNRSEIHPGAIGPRPQQDDWDYTHVSTKSIGNIKSALDTLHLRRGGDT
jgi:hypothetical protein